ncbi:hypothetical protein CQW23_05230 [Capsicum baccatum]|uniref:Uncharacterized protein n=1 Tax=Capsicum baccatum TaxID=33114 RepID=A0A2G2XGX5_CAPBA|nr:hypothetical protein CQW23_05230 [Capsicum baccatum]
MLSVWTQPGINQTPKRAEMDVVGWMIVETGIWSGVGESMSGHTIYEDEALKALEKTVVEPTLPTQAELLGKMICRLHVVWNAVKYLKSVRNNTELLSAMEDVQPEKVAFQLKLANINEAVLSGIALEGDEREQFHKIEQDLAKLSLKFEENVLDSTKKFKKLITDKNDIEGLPATALDLAAQAAVSMGHENATAEDGPWVITLDWSSYMSLMQYAKNSTLREEVYHVSSGGLDNTEIINQIHKLRLEKAKLLGYNDYAEVSKAMKEATAEECLKIPSAWDPVRIKEEKRIIFQDRLEKVRRLGHNNYEEVSMAEKMLASVDKDVEISEEQLPSASWDPAVKDLEDLKDFCKSQVSSEADAMAYRDISIWCWRLRKSEDDLSKKRQSSPILPDSGANEEEASNKRAKGKQAIER